MTKHRPRISVVIPTYNRAAALEGAVASVLAQSLAAHEIVLVDDGSTDDTGAVARTLRGPVRYVRQENAGAAAARNHGISLCEGELVAFLDSDDRWEPRKLEVQARVLEEEQEVGWVISDLLKVDEQGQALPGEPGIEAAVPVFRDRRDTPAEWMAHTMTRRDLYGGSQPVEVLVGDAFPLLLEGNFLFPSTLLVRRETLEKTGGFDAGYTRAEDMEFALRLAARSRMAFVNERFVHYRTGGVDSQTHPAHMELMTRFALRALDGAAGLRDGLTADELRNLRRGQRRILLDQAYADLTNLDQAGCRRWLRSLRDRSLPPGLRGRVLWLASLLPTGSLQAAHWLKHQRRLRSSVGRPVTDE